MKTVWDAARFHIIRFHKKGIVGYVVTSVTISKVRPLFMKLFRHFVSWIRQLSRFVKHFRPQHPVFTDFVSQKKFFRLCRYICNHISGKTVFHETYTLNCTPKSGHAKSGTGLLDPSCGQSILSLYFDHNAECLKDPRYGHPLM